DLEPIEKRMEALKKARANIEEKRAGLKLTARERGLWVSPKAEQVIGSWLPRGGEVGEIINPETFRFSAVVSQDESANLFINRILKAEVRIPGQSGINLDVTDYHIIPFQHERLPSAALGWLGGGDVAVSLSDESGLKTSEPFFQIYAEIKENQTIMLLHGLSGRLRFTMNPEPLLYQWGRSVRRMLQKRYQL
ncbi:hypothetical protein ACQZV8_18785, partial [Magnetococcales bacterium HHB-1]